MGEIRFYEGPAATQHYIGKISSKLSRDYDLSLISAPVSDQQAQSLTLIEVEPVTKIRLFDSATPSAEEECTEIVVQCFVENKMIPYFNVQTRDDEVDVKLRKGKDVQGLVSRIEIVSAES